MNQADPFKKMNQSIDHIVENLMTYVCLSPTQIILAKPVLQSLIGKFKTLLPELNQKIEECKIYDRKLLLVERYNKPSLDSGNCVRKRRSKQKLDPLSRAHESMSTTIEKLKDLIAAIHPHPFNQHDLERAEYTVERGVSMLNIWLKNVNKKTEKWDKCRNEFNQLIKEFGKVDKITADQIKIHWEELANGDKSAHSKVTNLTFEAVLKYRKNESVFPVLGELYAVVDEFL